MCFSFDFLALPPLFGQNLFPLVMPSVDIYPSVNDDLDSYIRFFLSLNYLPPFFVFAVLKESNKGVGCPMKGNARSSEET